jgi:hypothetical protein
MARYQRGHEYWPAGPMGQYPPKDGGAGNYDYKSGGGGGGGETSGENAAAWGVADTATSGIFSFLEALVTGEREAPPVTQHYYEDDSEPAPAPQDESVGGLGIPTWALIAGGGAVLVGLWFMLK